MSRSPTHRRRRPGRRPPYQYKGGPNPPRPSGFTGLGFGHAYRMILPGLDGSAKKRYFNELSGWLVASAGMCGLVLGLACLGPLGAVLGLGAGVTAGCSFARTHRFHRD